MCDHKTFEVNGRVVKLYSAGFVTGYILDITVKCEDCQRPFVFIGLKEEAARDRVSVSEPRTAQGRTKLRCPIQPH
jgi:hypothetical protein